MNVKLTSDRSLPEGDAIMVTESGGWYMGTPPRWEKDVEVLQKMFTYIRETIVEIRMSPKDLSAYNTNALSKRSGTTAFQYPISPEFD